MLGLRQICVCRLCLGTSYHLVDVLEENSDVEFVVKQAVVDLLQLVVVNEAVYPWLVCSICVEKLREFHLFKRRCVENQEVYANRIIGIIAPENEVWSSECDAIPIKLEEDNSVEDSLDHDPNKNIDNDHSNQTITEDISVDSKASKAVRKRRADDDLEQLLNSHTLNVKPGTATEETVAQCQEEERSPEAELAELRALKNVRESQPVVTRLEDLKALFEHVEKRKEEEMERRVRRAVVEVLEVKLAPIKKALTVNSTTINSTAGNCDTPSASTRVTSENEGMVHLGSGIYCQEAAYNTMQNAKEDSNWAKSLLIGVYGEEGAKKMRVFPRKEGLNSFSLTFLTVAKAMYRDRLVAMGAFNGDKVEVEKAVKQLPSYLADRSVDLNGPRGTVFSGNFINRGTPISSKSRQSKAAEVHHEVEYFGSQQQQQLSENDLEEVLEPQLLTRVNGNELANPQKSRKKQRRQ